MTVDRNGWGRSVCAFVFLRPKWLRIEVTKTEVDVQLCISDDTTVDSPGKAGISPPCTAGDLQLETLQAELNWLALSTIGRRRRACRWGTCPTIWCGNSSQRSASLWVNNETTRQWNCCYLFFRFVKSATSSLMVRSISHKQAYSYCFCSIALAL